MHAPVPELAGWGEIQPSQRSWTVLLAGAPGHGSASARGPAQLALHLASRLPLDQSQRKSLFCFSLLVGSCKEREGEGKRQWVLEAARCSHACLQELGGEGLLEAQANATWVPPSPSPVTSRVQELSLPFPGVVLVCKALVQAAPPGEQRLIPTSLLLGSHPRAGDRDPRPRQQPRTVLPGGEEAPKAPPAPAGGLTARRAPCTHTGRHGQRHLLGGCHQSHQCQSGCRVETHGAAPRGLR